MKVFISYSHDSREHNERVLQFANALRSHGVDAELDRYYVRPPKGWPHWCEEQLRPENSAFVLMICTETYLKRVQDKVPADEGRGVFWEGTIIFDYIYDEKGNTRFIPVLFPDGKTDFIPTPIRNHTRYQVGAFDLTDAGYQDLYRELTGQPLVKKPELGDIVDLGKALAFTARPLETKIVKTDFLSSEDLPPTAAFDCKVDISRILKYAPVELIGREDETDLLDDAWDKVVRVEKKRPHIITIVALGGEGKTSLVAKWVVELASKDWMGCNAAFAWSFYSQGTREQQAASSDLFLKEAITFFGNENDKLFAASPAGAYEKGQRLARIVGQKRGLLLLDGLEPLQYSPTSPMSGQLKDQGISALLRGLSQNSNGLCIVTSRHSLLDLKAFKGKTVLEKELKRLSKEAGVHLLNNIGVKGTKTEFETLVEDVKGHALTLTLIGSYLRDAHAGDIRKRDIVKLEEADAEEQGGHAFRVMDAYVKWLEGGVLTPSLSLEGEGTRSVNERKRSSEMLATLRLMGLFDRPMTADCFGALLEKSVIPGLTEPLVDMTEAQRNITLKRLEDAKLLTVNRDAAGALISLDAHPLIRDYFAKQLREKNPDAWKAGHKRLYKYLCETTKEGDEPTLEDLQPLYQAVAHGCQAGLHQEATDGVYVVRILRGKEHYSSGKLGSIGSDLGALAWFFDVQWHRVSPLVTEASQAFLLNQTCVCLLALGRLTEAEQPMRMATDWAAKENNWQHAAIGAANLNYVKFTLGEIVEGMAIAKQSVIYADRSGDWNQRVSSLCAYASTMHQMGRLSEAETLFHKAEQIQAKRQHFKLLGSVTGFHYCDLYLAVPERITWQSILQLDIRKTALRIAKTAYNTVARRAQQMLSWTEQTHLDILSPALDHLLLGRASFHEAILAKSNIQNSKSEIETAVSILRRAGQVHELPRGLLARAWLRAYMSDYAGAQADLDEAWEIAERGPMRLYMAEIHLYRARLFFREKRYPWESPEADLKAAEELINKCGYHRRDEELKDAKEAINKYLGG